jgi:hypothetical protein
MEGLIVFVISVRGREPHIRGKCSRSIRNKVCDATTPKPIGRRDLGLSGFPCDSVTDMLVRRPMEMNFCGRPGRRTMDGGGK